MSSRTAKFVSAIFATLLAGASFVTASHGAPAEAEKCLSGPKGAPPAGGHWYYRVDRATKRACWYVGDAKEKIARATPETLPPAADSASPPDSANTQSSIANARAEWPLPQSRVEQGTSIFTAPRPLATVAGAISPDSDPRANADDAGAQRSIVASRWGELAGSSTPASPEPATDNSTPANSRAAPTLSEAAPTPSSAPPTASRAGPTASKTALPLAAADASTEKPTGSVQMLLIAILGALALAGLLASAIFRLSGRRRNSSRGDRRVNWDSIRTDRPSLSDEARAARSMQERGLLPQGSLPRELRAADDPDERIAQLLSRPPRRAAS